MLLSGKNTTRHFLLSLFLVSLNFFLFSFHVHEKQLLLPMLIFGLLQCDTFKHYFTVMNLFAMFSMWHLAVKDKCQIAYLGLMIIWYFAFRPLESFVLQGFKMGNKQSIMIYNDTYKLNIVEN
jgi:hypothetical protein